jgi:hypothetical protein
MSIAARSVRWCWYVGSIVVPIAACVPDFTLHQAADSGRRPDSSLPIDVGARDTVSDTYDRDLGAGGSSLNDAGAAGRSIADGAGRDHETWEPDAQSNDETMIGSDVILSDAGPANDGEGGVVGPAARFVAPRVVYVGESRNVRVFGPRLGTATGYAVFVDDMNVGTLTAVRDREGTVVLPRLEIGEHFLRIGSASEHSAARLVTMPRTRYPDENFVLPGSVRSFIHDPERRAFFAILSAANGIGFNLVRIQFDGANWTLQTVDVPSPLGITMNPDGRELLVTNTGCVLIHVDPHSLKIGTIENLTPGCVYGEYEVIHALADGQVLYAASQSWARMWEYPGHRPVDSPMIHSVVSELSGYQTRLLWGEGTTISGTHPLYSYEVGSGKFEIFTTLGGDSYSTALAISGNGDRITHRGSVYDRNLHYLGGLGVEPGRVGLSGDGAVAVVYDDRLQTLRAYDVRGSSSPFPPLAPPVPFPLDMLGQAFQLFVDDDGQTAFLFTIRFLGGPSTTETRFVVRKVRGA